MSSERMIDLRSDTATRPTPAMLKAMSQAPLGDEQRGEDPTVNQLCRETAALLGKEAAIFLPSGTMSNLIATLVHCQRGDEIVMARNAHIIRAEAAGAAALAGAFVFALEREDGIFCGQDVKEAIRRSRRNAPRSRLVSIEQTTNVGGGKVWPLETIKGVAEVARESGLLMHMDGARLLNAVVASGVSARNYAQHFDSVWLDLSKGLGCPLGSVLAGEKDFIDRAWPWKHRLGGAMRQAGVVAAAGIYALKHHVERLREDHENATRLAALLGEIPGVTLKSDKIETNIVFFDLSGTGCSAQEIEQRLRARQVLIGASSEWAMRAVTHLDVDGDDIDRAVEAVAQCLSRS